MKTTHSEVSDWSGLAVVAFCLQYTFRSVHVYHKILHAHMEMDYLRLNVWAVRAFDVVSVVAKVQKLSDFSYSL